MNTAQRISSYLVAGAIAAALLFYAFGKVDSWLGRGDKETTAQSAALVQLVKAHARFRAKLAAAAKRQSVAAAAAHDSANALRASIAALPIEERPPRILVQIASRDSSAYAKCSVVVLDCERRASLAEADNRQLADQLRAQMKVKDHRCGIFVGYGVVAYNDSTAHARFAWQVGVGCRLSRLPLLP
jgi:hypothetical protein